MTDTRVSNDDTNCLFCKIIRGEIPAERLFENERFIAIRDIAPQAKFHALVIPKVHAASLADVYEATGAERVMGEAMRVVVQLAHQEGLLPGGFRTVINTNRDGGQTVFHLHLHVLGGEPLKGQFA